MKLKEVSYNPPVAVVFFKRKADVSDEAWQHIFSYTMRQVSKDEEVMNLIGSMLTSSDWGYLRRDYEWKVFRLTDNSLGTVRDGSA